MVQSQVPVTPMFLIFLGILVVMYLFLWKDTVTGNVNTVVFTNEDGGEILFPPEQENALLFSASVAPPAALGGLNSKGYKVNNGGGGDGGHYGQYEVQNSGDIHISTGRLVDPSTHDKFLQFDTVGDGSIYAHKLLNAEAGFSVCGNLDIKDGKIDGRDVAADGTVLDGLVTSVATNASTITTNDLAAVHLVGTETVSGDKTFSGTVNVSGTLNVPTPSANAHAVSKLYLDGMLQGYDHSKKAAVRVKTTAALPAHTGALGVLTATSNVALGVVNGVTLLLNERILVTENGTSNGIYVLSVVGSGSEPWELTRAADALTILSGLSVFVLEGTAESDTLWAVSTDVTIVMETTSILFVQISTIGQVVAVDVGGETAVVRDQIGDTINFRTLRGESGGPLSTVVIGGDVLEFQLDESKLGDTLTLIGINTTDIGNLEALTSVIEGDANGNLRYSGDLSSISTGSNNLIAGIGTGLSLGSGNNNTIFGNSAGLALATGLDNTIMGHDAYGTGANGNGNYNTAMGAATLLWATSASDNVCMGRWAGRQMTFGTRNIAIGMHAGRTIGGGHRNTYMGYHAGELNDGSDNVYLGNDAGSSLTSTSNRLVIANSNTTTPLIYGEFDNDIVTFNGIAGSGQTDVKLATDAITVTTGFVTVEPESGTADDLATINGGVAGSEITLVVLDDGDVITIKHGTDNIRCPGGIDFTLNQNNAVKLVKHGSVWKFIE